MPLTTAQRNTLRTAIQADAVLAPFYASGDLGGLAAALNADASPDFWVYKANVSIGEVGDNIVGSELAGLTTANNERLQTIAVLSPNGVNPSLADRRAFFDDVFGGAGGTQTRAKLAILWRRLASRFERVFATGTGTTAAPGLAPVPGPIDVSELIGL